MRRQTFVEHSDLANLVELSGTMRQVLLAQEVKFPCELREILRWLLLWTTAAYSPEVPNRDEKDGLTTTY